MSHPRAETGRGGWILEVHVTALHAAGEQDAVGALHKLRELVAFGLFHPLVARRAWVSDPRLGWRIPAEVRAEDDADVVELEALRGVDAADLIDAAGARGPEV